MSLLTVASAINNNNNIWQTETVNDALTGTTLVLTGDALIGGSLSTIGNARFGGAVSTIGNFVGLGNITGSNITASGTMLANSISAVNVNTLNTVLNTTTVSGNNITISNGTATVLNATSNSFSFVNGATYIVSVPFGASLTTANFAPPATTGDVKFFGCSATAFPIVASGNTPGLSVRCDSNNQSVFNTVQFVATAQATATEPIRIAGVPVGGLSNVVANLSIMPGGGTINAVNVSRIA
jgi:hypothetical protein